MSKLIELDAAIAETWKDTGYSDPLNVMTAIRDRLETLPTVDAAEVVRCKDCVRYLQTDEVWGRCTITPYLLRKKDFCSSGISKDGDGNDS